MALRILEIVTPTEKAPQVESALDEFSFHHLWCTERSDELVIWRALVDAERVEPVLDRLENRFGHLSAFRVIMQAVEAVVPAPSENGEDDAEGLNNKGEVAQGKAFRISRSELYEDIAAESAFDIRFVVMVTLATVVVTVGLIQDSSVIVLAAMVIAPLLGPNMALALGTTLGDASMIRRSAKAASAGFALALVLAIGYGTVGYLPDEGGEIIARTGFGASDLVLSLAAGVAGTLAYSTGAPSSLIGVMVAVALLPPSAAAGMYLGAGDLENAARAALLLTVNVVCVNLAALLIFSYKGIRPRTWIEQISAAKATRVNIGVLVFLLGLLAAAILILR